ncbi:3-deoxy-D-manno-octulosonic acid transferase [Minwuia thermotolerans]|uniref:3-deoxy-D-manno-octulosonic acid transferase n=1 Tax=Minwuia thermotolerans TaxID=2056226 RepID=A0A2M9FYA1_9PROT|nr:3-deoxy-D-manno-octulosonic acid transferase [Minwuia thermotolerans]PJK28434.1 3-deoxy-D-manno-octulosonic acid transferase [Minwuia thermotolerans]
MILWLYRRAGRAAAPLGQALLRRRLRAGKEDPDRIGERMGHASLPRPEGPLIWLHAASVGEAQSVLRLIHRLRAERPGTAILITTGTVTSGQMLSRDLPDGALHQYVPVDLPDATGRFVAHWRPDMAIWIESELWPNLLAAMAGTGRPMALINGRMSRRSWRRWRMAPGAARELLSAFRLILAQTDEAAARFADLGGANVRCEGNLKYAADPLPADEEELARLRGIVAARPFWIAASIHPGEDDIALDAHLTLRDSFPDLLTVLVPRHPARAADMARKAEKRGIAWSQRTAGQTPGPDCGVYIADTIGELGLFYRLDGPVFVGGSLVPHGGQNLLEPARFGRGLLTGPHTHNFADVVADLRSEGALIEVQDSEELAASLARLIAHADERNSLGARALAIAARQSAVLDRVMARLEPLLPGS